MCALCVHTVVLVHVCVMAWQARGGGLLWPGVFEALSSGMAVALCPLRWNCCLSICSVGVPVTGGGYVLAACTLQGWSYEQRVHVQYL